jgi:hypothetical protein
MQDEFGVPPHDRHIGMCRFACPASLMLRPTATARHGRVVVDTAGGGRDPTRGLEALLHGQVRHLLPSLARGCHAHRRLVDRRRKGQVGVHRLRSQEPVHAVKLAACNGRRLSMLGMRIPKDRSQRLARPRTPLISGLEGAENKHALLGEKTDKMLYEATVHFFSRGLDCDFSFESQPSVLSPNHPMIALALRAPDCA